jgi:hypothetical protein
MMPFRPNLQRAATATARVDALCEFIEFWLGLRRPSYGEPVEAVAARPLPTPLRRLYEFAGRWPGRDDHGPIRYAVPALSTQDALASLQHLKTAEDGKVIFLHENQGVWDCRTLFEGDDPPVWCHGDQADEHGDWFAGERLVCDSLSRFLVTFVLQELTVGSLLCLCDEGLVARFESERGSAVPVWTDGPYVHGGRHNYHLWGEVLVADAWDAHLLAANHPDGVRFLTENQGPVHEIHLMVWRPWTLDIRSDGSARLRYLSGQTDVAAEAPAGTFRFPDLLATVTAAGSDQGHYERNAMAYFPRKGQSSGLRGRHLHDGRLVSSLFRLALERAVVPNDALEKLFAAEWPL